MDIAGYEKMTRLRTLGRGASGAVVSLFAAGEELLAVKSAAAGTAAAEQLRREAQIMASLRSPHVLPCLGFRTAEEANREEHQLILEYAPGGSLADAAGKGRGGGLDEPSARAFAADVARGLAYLHDAACVVHGDVKAGNVVIGADGRAMLADFGCARPAGSKDPIGGTPAFMAPEVARGEEQGPAADIWALGCTVLEMATGRAPWSHQVTEVVAAVRLIGYTDAVPEVPHWLSADAKDFLGKCLCRDAGERWTAARLLEHPFLASAGPKARWVSPKSTLDAALWESDAEEESDDDELPEDDDGPADRIRSLAGPCSALPEWESDDDDDGWIEVCRCEVSVSDDRKAAATESQDPTLCEVFSVSEAAPETSCSSTETRGKALDRPAVPSATEETGRNFRGGEHEPEEAEVEEIFAADDWADDPVQNVGGGDVHRQQQEDILEDSGAVHDYLDSTTSSVSDEEIIKSAFFPVNSPPLLVVLCSAPLPCSSFNISVFH